MFDHVWICGLCVLSWWTHEWTWCPVRFFTLLPFSLKIMRCSGWGSESLKNYLKAIQFSQQLFAFQSSEVTRITNLYCPHPWWPSAQLFHPYTVPLGAGLDSHHSIFVSDHLSTAFILHLSFSFYLHMSDLRKRSHRIIRKLKLRGGAHTERSSNRNKAAGGTAVLPVSCRNRKPAQRRPDELLHSFRGESL